MGAQTDTASTLQNFLGGGSGSSTTGGIGLGGGALSSQPYSVLNGNNILGQPSNASGSTPTPTGVPTFNPASNTSTSSLNALQQSLGQTQSAQSKF